MSSMNITVKSLIPVSNSKHEKNYSQNNENRDQAKKNIDSFSEHQKLSDENQNGNQASITNREISKKKQLLIRNLQGDTAKEDLHKLFDLRSMHHLKQSCMVNMPLMDKTGKSKGFTFIVTSEKVQQIRNC